MEAIELCFGEEIEEVARTETAPGDPEREDSDGHSGDPRFSMDLPTKPGTKQGRDAGGNQAAKPTWFKQHLSTSN